MSHISPAETRRHHDQTHQGPEGADPGSRRVDPVTGRRKAAAVAMEGVLPPPTRSCARGREEEEGVGRSPAAAFLAAA
ncbi:unnamed protein product [Urochloa humidicola]